MLSYRDGAWSFEGDSCGPVLFKMDKISIYYKVHCNCNGNWLVYCLKAWNGKCIFKLNVDMLHFCCKLIPLMRSSKFAFLMRSKIQFIISKSDFLGFFSFYLYNHHYRNEIPVFITAIVNFPKEKVTSPVREGVKHWRNKGHLWKGNNVFSYLLWHLNPTLHCTLKFSILSILV